MPMSVIEEAPPITDGELPPGPSLPRAAQTAGFLLAGPRFLEACRRRYGNAVTFSTLFDSRFVMLFDPEFVKTVFQGSPDQLHAGEANALLGPVVGDRSVLLLDGAEHLRHRRLMLPQFHGRRMQAYEDVMRESTDIEIDSWPVGEPFPLFGSMQSLTLRVIMRAVFGYEPGAAEDELRARLRKMIEPLARPRGMLLLSLLGRRGPDQAAARRFEQKPPRGRRRPVRRDRPPARRSVARVQGRRVLGAAPRRGRGREPPERPGGARRARDAPARRPRDDRHRSGLDVRHAAPRPCGPQARPRRRRRLSGRGRQGVAADPAGDRGRRPRRPGRAVPRERLCHPAGRRDQPLDPHDPPPPRSVSRSRHGSGPSGS